MKLSDVLHYVSGFVLAITTVGITAVTVNVVEYNLLLSSELLQGSSEPLIIPQISLRDGYIGDFGYSAPLPQTPKEYYVDLPVVTYRQLPSAGAPPTVSQSETKTVKRPHIRVGLFDTDETNSAITVAGESNVVLANTGKIRKKVKEGTRIKLRYNKTSEKYIVKVGNWRHASTQPIRVEPTAPNTVATIVNYENRPAWDTSLNDNVFLGTIELQYAPATDKIWVINELGIENYLKGIGEAGNENDEAYLKTLMTAARSYVYYHYNNPTKHTDEPYLVDTTPNDQVYKGYGITMRSPNIASAVEATRGKIVHYQDEPVVTPYFSKTDGRTRAWSEVWNGEKEYLQSVDDPCCSDETLTGHGVGLSAEGARYFAEESDWGWKKILKYYYQDVTIKKLWK